MMILTEFNIQYIVSYCTLIFKRFFMKYCKHSMNIFCRNLTVCKKNVNFTKDGARCEGFWLTNAAEIIIIIKNPCNIP